MKIPKKKLKHEAIKGPLMISKTEYIRRNLSRMNGNFCDV